MTISVYLKQGKLAEFGLLVDLIRNSVHLALKSVYYSEKTTLIAWGGIG